MEAVVRCPAVVAGAADVVVGPEPAEVLEAVSAVVLAVVTLVLVVARDVEVEVDARSSARRAVSDPPVSRTRR